jgi:hypothetical protein
VRSSHVEKHANVIGRWAREQAVCALEQARGRAAVAAAECPVPGSREKLSGPRARLEICVRQRPQLTPVPERLLEVVTGDLVELDQIRASFLQPGREALVELRARRLGQRLVGRIADQQVAEAVAVLPCQL